MHAVGIISVALLFSGFLLRSQDFQSQFDQFKTKAELEYEKTVLAQDSIFAKAMMDHWLAIELNPALSLDVQSPKPDVKPTVTESFELLNVHHQVVQTKPRLTRSFSPVAFEATEMSEEFELQEKWSFYGEDIAINYSIHFLKQGKKVVKDAAGISDAWQTLSKSPYRNIVESLRRKAEMLELPDYGYLLLVQSFVDRLDMSSSNRALYKWFLLAKSGFVVRVGLLDAQPVLVLATLGKIYGTRYYSDQGIQFYIMSDIKGSFESYQLDSDLDGNLFDFAIRKEIKLPLSPVKKTIQYIASNKVPIDLTIYSNKNVHDLLTDFPQSELPFYLTSHSSDLLARSLLQSLKPYMSDLTETQRISFLLEFVQKAFEYRTDQLQFGRERTMYPEELFFFPYSDCDDRVALMAYLLRLFTDTPTVAITFPQHVALAVRLPAPTFGETIKHKGYTFTFCDPTYYSAPLGSVIPSADRSKISVVEF
jgi:hypothetical protein